MSSFITIKELSKTYNNTIALNAISLNIERGELFGVIGPDGAGKTTLFRILTTLLLFDSGEVTIDNLNVITHHKILRKNIGYMPGRFSLYMDLTVEENLYFFATVFGTSINENYELIKDIYSQLEPFKNRKAGKLSGGMKQKLALSCALIHKPKLLILDEPTTGVDAVSRSEFWEILKTLNQKNITILVSTPYMDEASMCNRVALINNGKFLAINTPNKIIETFNKQLFSVRTNDMYKLICDLQYYRYTHSIYLFGQYLHYTDKNPNPNITQLTNYLNEKQHTGIEIKHVNATIEDCFMELMTP